ncbi:uncharacterized protein Z518_10425 [Rhinocladiella mackenziei CBS 650.93]|uniref:AB hydrolase-1 domain-containing protein n=1 Tax=Rhinocladiella mackenziei CBS 650.93 TaxID=1442369 RepID=A0A0D2IAK5_9EURO|nr:uncharacterized protein Z518_10425 [Rhinocladiella mackenziei CBS 650.93]KIX00286.1 hypothetical protein Z518_10425 [Rhinocladiella mackenziei CBS 650.93]
MTASSAQRGKQCLVEFLSDGLTIRGVLRLPNGDGPYPIVILAHGLGALKEWTIPEVADALVEAGIAGLWFDYRNFGDSEGEPREEVAHYGRLEDWQSAISYATSLPEIDSQNIGIWGTSLGGRDVLAVAGIDRRVKAVLSQTPLIKWIPSAAARMAGFGDDLDRFQRELAEDRKNRALGKEPRYIPFVKDSGDDAKREYLETLSEAELRNYKARLTLQSYQPTVLADVTPLIELIAPIPLRFIIAEDDFLPGQREAYNAAKDPKSLVTIGGHHFSPYTTSKREAIVAAKEWFVKYLTSK